MESLDGIRPIDWKTVERERWRDAVDAAGAEWRYELAAGHDERAAAAGVIVAIVELARRATVYQTMNIDAAAELRANTMDAMRRYVRWHRGRAAGLRDGESRAAICARDELRVRPACGCDAGRTIPRRCGRMSCHACRGIRAARERRRLRRGMRDALDDARMRYRASSRSWRDVRPRFVTLPVPPTGDIARDVEIVQRARGTFIHELRRMIAVELELDERRAKLPYFGAIEIGDRGIVGGEHEGLAHVHLWIATPFVSHAVIAMLWGHALEAAGHPSVPMAPRAEIEAQYGAWGNRTAATMARYLGRGWTHAPRPMIDVRAARRGIEDELIKYIVKDYTAARGDHIAPEDYSRILRARRGRRFVLASRGDFGRDDPKPCECGCARYVVERVDGAASGLDTSVISRDGGRPPPAQLTMPGLGAGLIPLG